MVHVPPSICLVMSQDEVNSAPSEVSADSEWKRLDLPGVLKCPRSDYNLEIVYFHKTFTAPYEYLKIDQFDDAVEALASFGRGNYWE